jgi:hypothetical protein
MDNELTAEEERQLRATTLYFATQAHGDMAPKKLKMAPQTCSAMRSDFTLYGWSIRGSSEWYMAGSLECIR